MSRKTQPITLVVPCYNEEIRLPRDYWESLFALPGFRWVFVNDGSTDGTQAVLAQLAHQYEHVEALNLPVNQGKAEAVRQGMLHAFRLGDSTAIGFVDSDGSFPVDEIARFAELFAKPEEISFDAVWASRNGPDTVNEEKPSLLRRIGSVVVSAIIHVGNPSMPSDTQCGFKLFLPTPALRVALAAPFRTRWLFDIELFYRLPGLVIREETLRYWVDAPNSRITRSQAISIFAQLATVTRIGLNARRGK